MKNSLKWVILLMVFFICLTTSFAQQTPELFLEGQARILVNGNKDLHYGGCWLPPEPIHVLFVMTSN